MSARLPLEPDGAGRGQLPLSPRATRARRAHRARVRRRRLLVLDMGVAALLALIGILLAPGLAVLGIAAVLVLLGCGISLLYAKLRRRRSPRP